MSVSFTAFYLYKMGNYTSMFPEQTLHVTMPAVKHCVAEVNNKVQIYMLQRLLKIHAPEQRNVHSYHFNTGPFIKVYSIHTAGGKE